jgi:hypothetical protein
VHLLALLLCAFTAGSETAADETAAQIERLAAPHAAERAQAERWLAVHLSVQAFPQVAAAFAAGEAEVRERLIEALASDDRHLELAALAATDARETVQSGGRAAIEELVARWNPAALERPADARLLPESWVEEHTRPLSLALGKRSLADHLDQLVRLGGGPATVVLDPGLDPSVFARLPDERLTRNRSIGTWGEELQAIAAAWRVSFVVHGRHEALDGTAEDEHAWVLVCKRGSETDSRGADLVVAWCQGLLRELDPRGNLACARALGALGWPAGLQWLEHRWSALGDAAALEGLLIAAGRGWVVPGLADPAALRGLLADLDRRLVAAETGSFARAERLAAALYALGPSTSGGESVAEILVEGWDALAPASRWVRMVGLEGTRGRSDRGQADCVALLASDAQPALRAQALRALVALSGPRAKLPALSEATPLLEWARLHGRLDVVVRSLTDLGAPFSAAASAGKSDTAPEIALACLDWAAHAGDDATALSLCERLLRTEDDLDGMARRLTEWGELGAGDVGDRLCAALRSEPRTRFEPASLERLFLRAGRLEPSAAATILERLAGLAQPTPGDARDLGELCAHPDLGWKAREALLAWIRPEVSADVLSAGFARAQLALRRTRADFEASALARRARELAVRSSHPLVEVLLAPDWPPLPAAQPDDLDARDHILEL